MANCLFRFKNFTVVTSLPLRHLYVMRNEGLATPQVSTDTKLRVALKGWKLSFTV